MCDSYGSFSSEFIYCLEAAKAQRKQTSKNAKQMRDTNRNCFSHSSASYRNDKQCFVNQTNRCPAGFAPRSDLFPDNVNKTSSKR